MEDIQLTSSISDLAEKLADVRVDVRSDLEITRQIFSGKPSYVLRDPIHSQSFQLSAADYQLLIHINSHSTLSNIFEQLCQQGILNESDHQHFYELILHLHQVGILSLPISDGKALHRRHLRWKADRQKWSLQKVLFCRVPIWKPDRFLERTSNWLRFLFSSPFMIVWAVGLMVCLSLIGLRWEEFKQPTNSMLTLENLPWVWCILVGLKAFHELGHAYACKIFGGHVPEIGLYFILFTPCAYVDASSSWGFPKRRHRLVVGLAGMYFESLCAMAATAVWALTAPGLVHSLAVYAIVLSTAITIAFNANPLMRYDGYFILSDLINIPNLRSLSKHYFWGWCKHIAFGIEKPSVHHPRLIRCFLALFGICSSIYMLTVVLSICYFVTFRIPEIGPWVGGFLFLSTIWKFVGSQIRYLVTSPELAGHRRRAFVVVGILVISATGMISMIPVQRELTFDGTVEWDRVERISSPVEGHVQKVLAREGDRLSPGDVVIEVDSPQLQEDLARYSSDVAALTAKLHRQIARDDEHVELTRAELQLARRNTERALRRSAQTVVVSSDKGQLLDDIPLPLPGDHVSEGESLCKIGTGAWVVRLRLSDQAQTTCAPEVGDLIRFRIAREPLVDRWGQVSRVVVRTDRNEEFAANIATTSRMRTNQRVHPTALEFELTVHCLNLHSKRLFHGDAALVKLECRRQTVGTMLWLKGLQFWQELLLQGA